MYDDEGTMVNVHFAQYSKLFQEATQLLSLTNICFQNSVMYYCVILINNIVIWIYMGLVFRGCLLPDATFVQIPCDSMVVLIMLALASNVQSKVRIICLQKVSALLNNT